jgi:acetyl-CoA/propionyl-CoA carboxylase biotin carboxyl carrier protein
MTVPQAFDSLIAKLIVTGASRAEALQRARRALAEFEVGGMPTVLPFHRAVVTDPAFTAEPLRVHTRWIETEFSRRDAAAGSAPRSPRPADRERITVEVGGKRLEVVVPGSAGGPAGPGGAGTRGAGWPGRAAPGRELPGRVAGRRPGCARGQGGDTLVSPMQGTIVKIVAARGSRSRPGT